MSFRSRIYRTVKVGKGRRMIMSGKLSDWIVYDALAWIFRVLYYCCFFWIIIPIKIFKKKH